jgi:hypothetical protein
MCTRVWTYRVLNGLPLGGDAAQALTLLGESDDCGMVLVMMMVFVVKTLRTMVMSQQRAAR